LEYRIAPLIKASYSPIWGRKPWKYGEDIKRYSLENSSPPRATRAALSKNEFIRIMIETPNKVLQLSLTRTKEVAKSSFHGWKSSIVAAKDT
jgi:hypothetical protein